MIAQTILFAAAEIEQRDSGDVNALPTVSADDGAVETILGIAFGTFAAIAIVVIIIAGINFITAEGNPEKLSKAKKAIIFALLGLVISLGAQIIVFFVIGRLG